MFSELSEKLQSIIASVSGNVSITEDNIQDALREIRRALLAADVSLTTVKAFITDIKEKALGAEVVKSVKPSEMLIKIVNDELIKILGSENSKLNLTSKPSVIIMLGLQGSGKTTSSAKLALMLKKDGKKPLIIAADVYRPAAILQIETLSKDNEIDFFKIEDTKDVQKIVKQGLEFAKENNNNVVIIDTAGRLQIDSEMMAELMLIERTVKTDEKLLVIDSMTGQEAINVAKNFDEQLGITGVILTKLDGDTRGGAALSVVHSTGKPIKLIGTGEKIEPLEEFHPDRIASRILGMGDIVSLVEKAQKNIDIEETKKLEENIMKNRFSFNDFLKMQKQLKMLGSFGGILGMLPIKGLKSEDKDKISSEGEKHLKKFEVMISSMSPKERLQPDLINGSRKARIAKGAGMDISEVNALINEFNQMRSMMSMFSGMKQGKMPNMADVMNKMRNKKIKFK